MTKESLYYAKTVPVQTIAEHTNALLTEYSRLKQIYGNKISGADPSFWRLLELAVQFHDIGKAYTPFQNKLRKYMGMQLLPVDNGLDLIPHNYLSVALIPFEQLQLDRRSEELLIAAVGFHHERKERPDLQQIRFAYEADFQPRIRECYVHLGLNYEPEPFPRRQIRMLEHCLSMRKSNQLYNDAEYRLLHVLLKGLLHRIDHAASAGVDVEDGVQERIGEKTAMFMQKRGFKCREPQQFAWENRDKHVIMTASTGMGKTESALLWLDEDKGFFTLPLRVSLNGMYSRLQDRQGIGIESVGLLHSGSRDFLQVFANEDSAASMDEAAEYSDNDETYERSRQLAARLMLSTIDQVLKFPFRYRGFERELASLSYAKVVIDEIQSYSPQIAAMLIVALEMIHEMGGKFMLMTATLPDLYVEELKRGGIVPEDQVALGEFPNHSLLRHRLEIREASILALAQEIWEKGKMAKVLVIANTVQRAVEMAEELSRLAEESGDRTFPFLLHSRFTQEDRLRLEKAITSFAPSGWHESTEGAAKPGIWVTTQIVEASLDIDFDLLYTEMCPLDSLFQRMGRCYRVRSYDGQTPNVVIAAAECSGIGSVYHEQIFERSLHRLQKWHLQFMTEAEKMKEVKELYSRKELAGTKFLRDFENAIDMFRNLPYFEMDRHKAQDMLRDISSIQVIPEVFFCQVDTLIEQYNETKEKKQKRRLGAAIEKMAVSVSESWIRANQMKPERIKVRGLEHLYRLYQDDAYYEFDPQSGTGRGLVSAKSPFFM